MKPLAYFHYLKHIHHYGTPNAVVSVLMRFSSGVDDLRRRLKKWRF